jgi:hypothetical protein
VSGFAEGELDSGGWALAWGVCVASVGWITWIRVAAVGGAEAGGGDVLLVRSSQYKKWREKD